MIILRSILVVVEALCSLLLIALVLVQKSKNEGLGLAFGSGMGETLFGSRAGNVLTKATIVLAVVFMVNTLTLAVVYSGAQRQSLMQRHLGMQPGTPPAPTRPVASAPQEVPAGGAPTLPGTRFEGEAAASAPEGSAPAMPAMPTMHFKVEEAAPGTPVVIGTTEQAPASE